MGEVFVLIQKIDTFLFFGYQKCVVNLIWNNIVSMVLKVLRNFTIYYLQITIYNLLLLYREKKKLITKK